MKNTAKSEEWAWPEKEEEFKYGKGHLILVTIINQNKSPTFYPGL